MRKLIIEEWISLDGNIADKEGKLDFFAHHVRESYASKDRINFLKDIDTIIFGCKTYAQFASLWPGRPVKNEPLAEKMNTTQKIVFSNSLSNAPWSKWNAAEIERDNLTVC